MERVRIANTNPKKAGAPILRKQTLKTKVLQGIRRLVYNETKFKSLQRSIIIREMQMKTAMKYHLILVRMAIIKMSIK